MESGADALKKLVGSILSSQEFRESLFGERAKGFDIPAASSYLIVVTYRVLLLSLRRVGEQFVVEHSVELLVIHGKTSVIHDQITSVDIF